MRLAPVLAIAWRDLAQELRGRRGWVLPIVSTLLLLFVAAFPREFPSVSRGDAPISVWRAKGEVPEAVAAIDSVTVTSNDWAHFLFRSHEDEDWSGLQVTSRYIPPEIREVLDGPEPPVIRVDVQVKSDLPDRTALLALIAASVLTGAVSGSIAGERSRRSLETLLAAAVNRSEIVVGKWLAWGGYGAGSAVLAAAATIAFGNAEIGLWLIPLPTVSLAMVALGLYLTRRASDIVGGATVSLRVLPALLSLLGLAAWSAGLASPWLGALVPIGGALVATGGMWPGAPAALLASVVTLLTTVGLLVLTVRDLRAHPPRPQQSLARAPFTLCMTLTLFVAVWIPTLGPLLWGKAGNPILTETLDRAPGVAAVGVGLIALILWQLARTPVGPRRTIGLYAPPADGWLAGTLAGITLAISGSLSGWVALPSDPTLTHVRIRLADTLEPSWTGFVIAILAIVGQELMFRGWLQQRLGPFVATAIFIVVMGPLDPIYTAVLGISLAALVSAAEGSVWPALVARIAMLVFSPLCPPLSPLFTSAVMAVVLAILIGRAVVANRVEAWTRELG